MGILNAFCLSTYLWRRHEYIARFPFVHAAVWVLFLLNTILQAVFLAEKRTTLGVCMSYAVYFFGIPMKQLLCLLAYVKFVFTFNMNKQQYYTTPTLKFDQQKKKKL